MSKAIPVKDRVIDAMKQGCKHVDSIALLADSSETFVRRVLNKLAEDGDIQKVYGRAHHTYLLNGEEL